MRDARRQVAHHDCRYSRKPEKGRPFALALSLWEFYSNCVRGSARLIGRVMHASPAVQPRPPDTFTSAAVPLPLKVAMTIKDNKRINYLERHEFKSTMIICTAMDGCVGRTVER